MEGFANVRVGLVASQVRSQVDGDLLVAQGGLEDGLVAWIEPVNRGLLLVVDPTRAGQKRLDLAVVGHACERMREQDALGLDAVHQDDSSPRVGFDVELVDRLLHDLLPGAVLLVERDSLLVPGVKC